LHSGGGEKLSFNDLSEAGVQWLITNLSDKESLAKKEAPVNCQTNF
jgi:hypothetical protein